MIDDLIAGKIHGQPEQRAGKSGRAFTVAKVRAAAGEGEAVFVNVLAFSETALAALLALTEGDAVTLAGQLTPRAWIDREGISRPSLDLLAQQVLTVYHAKRRREALQPRPSALARDERPDALGLIDDGTEARERG